MASVTRDDLVEQARAWADATGSERWDDTLEIVPVLSSIYDKEWSNILAVAPYYRLATRSVTSTASGQITLTDLNSGSGDSAQNWHRVITVASGNYLYDETRFQDVPLGTSTTWPSNGARLYYFAGTAIQLLPNTASLALSVTVNYKPVSLIDMSAGTVAIDFPANSHLILVYEAAAQLLMKADTETNDAASLRQMAARERDLMLADIQRRSINPLRVMPMDDARDWAG